MKIAATTFVETGVDVLAQYLKVGYASFTLMFLYPLVLLTGLFALVKRTRSLLDNARRPAD